VTVTYYFEHVKHIAKGMVQRYGASRALEECARNRDSPLTTDSGRKFWGLVYSEIELVIGSRAAKS
jgi:hypothetical protein